LGVGVSCSLGVESGQCPQPADHRAVLGQIGHPGCGGYCRSAVPGEVLILSETCGVLGRRETVFALPMQADAGGGPVFGAGQKQHLACGLSGGGRGVFPPGRGLGALSIRAGVFPPRRNWPDFTSSPMNPSEASGGLPAIGCSSPSPTLSKTSGSPLGRWYKAEALASSMKKKSF